MPCLQKYFLSPSDLFYDRKFKWCVIYTGGPKKTDDFQNFVTGK